MICRLLLASIFSIASIGLAANGLSQFDVASIKPSQPGAHPVDCNTLQGGVFTCRNARAEWLFRLAFGFKFSTIKGAPRWFDELYDVNAKIKPSSPGTASSAKVSDEGWLIKGETMQAFATSLARLPEINARVIDNTGLVGQFDFGLPYIISRGNAGAADSSIFDALLSIGLRLREEKRDATALVIDQIHRPSEN